MHHRQSSLPLQSTVEEKDCRDIHLHNDERKLKFFKEKKIKENRKSSLMKKKDQNVEKCLQCGRTNLWVWNEWAPG